MPQVLVRHGGYYVIIDSELALVCKGDTSLANPALVGLAFKIGEGWRSLRLGLVDIGIDENRAAAVERIVADHERRTFTPGLDHRTKSALPI